MIKMEGWKGCWEGISNGGIGRLSIVKERKTKGKFVAAKVEWERVVLPTR